MGTFLEQITLVELTLFGSAVFLIKELTAVIFNWIKNELEFRQKSNHAKKQVELDLDIEMRKKKQQVNLVLEERKLDDNGNLLEDLKEVYDIVIWLREWFNAFGVSINIFHNGVAKNFKNYSMRFEDTRNLADAQINQFQVKPLSNFYQSIKRFEDEQVIVYEVNDTANNENKNTLGIIKSLGLKKMLVAALLVEDGTNLPQEQKVLQIKRKTGNYYLLGMLSVGLDEHSKDIDFDTAQTVLLRKVDDIMKVYNRNQKVLG